MRLILIFLIPSLSLALPSFTGLYGGVSSNELTYFSGKLTARSFLKRIEIAGLSAACTVQIPDQLPIEETRTTNITRDETPIVRVRANGKFSDQFDLISESRVDFKDATVNIRGRIRNGAGRVNLEIIQNKTYEDSSTEICYGYIRIPLRRP